MAIGIEYARQALAESYCAAVDTVARERRYLATIEGFPVESTKGYVAMIIAQNFAQFYALDNNEVVGWCDIIPKGFEGMRHVGVLGMGLLPGYRGQGVGSLLLQHTMDHAFRLNGIEKIELEVFASNVEAIGLYKHYGFEIEGRRLGARKLDGVTDDIILMGKSI